MQVSEATAENLKCVMCAKDPRIGKRLPQPISDNSAHETHAARFSRVKNIFVEIDHRS